MLEPSFLSKVTELTCADPEFKRFLLRVLGYDAIFCIIIVHGIDLVHCTLGTGCW